MKLTKTFALAALVAGSLIAGSAALQAQDNTNTPPAGGPPAGFRGRPNLDQIAKELGLTEDQKAKFKTIMEDQQTKLKALRADTSLSQEDKRAQAKELRTATQTQLKALLTPEQLAKWQQHMHGNRPPGGTPPTAPPQQ